MITFGFVLIVAIPFFIMGKFSRKLGKQDTLTSNEYVSTLQENFSLAKIIISFAKHAQSSKNLIVKFNNHVKATIKSQTFAMLLSNLYIPFFSQ